MESAEGLEIKKESLISTLKSEFRNRTFVETKNNCDLNLDIQIKENTVWLIFFNKEYLYTVTAPLPFIDNGVLFINYNNIKRPICNFLLKDSNLELDYISMLYNLLLCNPNAYIYNDKNKQTPYIQQIIYAFKNNNAHIITYNLQKDINKLITRFPLHETQLNSFVVNQRIIIIDEFFESLSSPQEILDYQVNKSKKYFKHGWTSLGLSDGVLAHNNYILKFDIRRLTPFGLKMHNPQRNLYSILGMKGDEKPRILTETANKLENQGVGPTGWNFFTAFVDTKDTFEDQIIVDESHKDKLFVSYNYRIQVYGELIVKENKLIKTNSILGYTEEGEEEKFEVLCDGGYIKEITQIESVIGGKKVKVNDLKIIYKRNFKEGFKLTNMHGNKGVIAFKKLGYAVSPVDGSKRKIDIIVSAKTVPKRKNYGQIIELLINSAIEVDKAELPVIIKDDWGMEKEDLKAHMVKRGFRSNGTWDCKTYAGDVRAICGNMFWGCIKTPEDQIWKNNATRNMDLKGIRSAGHKFSTIEFRSLETIFGKDNAIVEEILNYSQGLKITKELLNILNSKRNIIHTTKPVKKVDEIKLLDQSKGIMINGQDIEGTIVDEFLHPTGFLLELPLKYMVIVDNNDDVNFEGNVVDLNLLSEEEKSKIKEVHVLDKIYIPNGVLRKCWKHPSGKYGLSDVGILLNAIISICKRLQREPENQFVYKFYYNAIHNYFLQVAKMLGSKRGYISNFTMSIRYPFSIKAVATQSSSLPKNTIEIHESQAKKLNVKDGDVVIAERFPCLGFMSIRPQYVKVTNDKQCKYVIRVSGNSLVSSNLDHDGDVLFVSSFHTEQSKKILQKEMDSPNPIYHEVIEKYNKKKGEPEILQLNIDDYEIKPYGNLTEDEYASIVRKNTGIKAQTGPAIALAYNITRILERTNNFEDYQSKVNIDVFLERASQSVFEQKHGGTSLFDIVLNSVCTGDVDSLVKNGFDKNTSEIICNLTRDEASKLGVNDLHNYHKTAEKKGRSNIVSLIVRNGNKIYFASRAQLEGIKLLKLLESEVVDLPSYLFKKLIHKKKKFINNEEINTINNKELVKLKNKDFKEATVALSNIIDSIIC